MAEKKRSEMAHLRAHPFYVGSRSILNANRTWPKKTIAEAIKHAQTLVDDTGEDQFVVKVVRIVRRRATPVIVEKL